MIDFDGVHDGCLIMNKPHSCTGPQAQTVVAAPTNDASTMLLATIIPLFTTLSQKRPWSRSQSPPCQIPLSPSTHHHAKLASLLLSPVLSFACA